MFCGIQHTQTLAPYGARSVHMPNPRGNRRPQRGQKAIQKMARNSKDQAPQLSAKARTAKNGILNGYGLDIKAMKRDLMMVKSLLNVEEKHIDTLGTSTVVASASVVLPIGTVAQGSSSSQRTGDSIKIIRHDLNLLFNYSNGTPATSAQENQNFNWYYIKYNKTPSSSGATAFAISEFLNQDTNGVYTPLSLVNPDTNENFTILDAGQVSIGPNFLGTISVNANQFVESSLKHSFHQTYNGSASTNVCDNMTFLVVIASTGINTGGISTLSYGIRQWYVDN